MMISELFRNAQLRAIKKKIEKNKKIMQERHQKKLDCIDKYGEENYNRLMNISHFALFRHFETLCGDDVGRSFELFDNISYYEFVKDDFDGIEDFLTYFEKIPKTQPPVNKK